MLQKLKRLIGASDRSEKSAAISGELLKDQRLTNSINEIQFLEGHTDIVRLLLRIDQRRFCSGGDDGAVLVWDSDSGELLLRLVGHANQVTCLLLLDRDTLVTGGSDKTLRLWSLIDGKCSKVVEQAHNGSVKCLTRINTNQFCSGGNDRYLRVWNNDGTAVGAIERQEEENLHCMTAISGNKLVTGSTSSLLLVYNTETLKFMKLLAYHRESIRCIVNLNTESFISASLDGAIVIWNSDSLNPTCKLEYPDKFKTEHNQFILPVHHLERLGYNYIAACISNGFRIYDIQTGDCVMDCQGAHEGNVNHIIPLYSGTRLITCSGDASVRIWGTKEDFTFRRSISTQNGSVSTSGEFLTTSSVSISSEDIISTNNNNNSPGGSSSAKSIPIPTVNNKRVLSMAKSASTNKLSANRKKNKTYVP
jgi:WD40 repeat protein